LITELELFEALKGVTDLEWGKDVVESGMVRDLRETAKVLKRFLAAYEEHVEEGESEHH